MNERRDRHEAYDDWYRSGKKRVQVHGANKKGKALMKRQIKRTQVLPGRELQLKAVGTMDSTTS